MRMPLSPQHERHLLNINADGLQLWCQAREGVTVVWRIPKYRSGTQMAATNLCPDREDQIFGIFVRMASGFQFFYAQNLSG